MTLHSLKPFVKWAGGKSQLLCDIKSKYPSGLGSVINRYCEPFLGGGAVLFDILSSYRIDEVLINDINSELINCYSVIKNNHLALIDYLQILEKEFLLLDSDGRKNYYYDKRDKFNNTELNFLNAAFKASLFIFLNRTCFNGLYRVNKKGYYNVPIGKYKSPMICDGYNLCLIHEALQNVSIKCGDFFDCFSFIDDRTFVYLDPPYRPISSTSSFTSYSPEQFDDKSQIRLKKFIDNINDLSAKVVLSNSDPKNTDTEENFFDDLYCKYNISRVFAKRMINRNGLSRGEVSELLISNF